MQRQHEAARESVGVVPPLYPRDRSTGYMSEFVPINDVAKFEFEPNRENWTEIYIVLGDVRIAKHGEGATWVPLVPGLKIKNTPGALVFEMIVDDAIH
jgi:hypothetical protein